MDLLQQNTLLGHALLRPISLIIDRIAEKAFRKNLRDRYILIAIDDIVRAIGLDRVKHYVKWLCDLMWKLIEDLDNIMGKITRNMAKIEDILVENNMLIRVEYL
ncbi:MAG: hypothetical protein QXY40_04340 [Candidatus Methanomethylicia archaeon]